MGGKKRSPGKDTKLGPSEAAPGAEPVASAQAAKKESPAKGDKSPAKGERSPAKGERSPAKGERSPAKGEKKGVQPVGAKEPKKPEHADAADGGDDEQWTTHEKKPRPEPQVKLVYCPGGESIEALVPRKYVEMTPRLQKQLEDRQFARVCLNQIHRGYCGEKDCKWAHAAAEATKHFHKAFGLPDLSESIRLTAGPGWAAYVPADAVIPGRESNAWCVKNRTPSPRCDGSGCGYAHVKPGRLAEVRGLMERGCVDPRKYGTWPSTEASVCIYGLSETAAAKVAGAYGHVIRYCRVGPEAVVVEFAFAQHAQLSVGGSYETAAGEPKYIEAAKGAIRVDEAVKYFPPPPPVAPSPKTTPPVTPTKKTVWNVTPSPQVTPNHTPPGVPKALPGSVVGSEPPERKSPPLRPPRGMPPPEGSTAKEEKKKKKEKKVKESKTTPSPPSPPQPTQEEERRIDPECPDCKAYTYEEFKAEYRDEADARWEDAERWEDAKDDCALHTPPKPKEEEQDKQRHPDACRVSSPGRAPVLETGRDECAPADWKEELVRYLEGEAVDSGRAAAMAHAFEGLGCTRTKDVVICIKKVLEDPSGCRAYNDKLEGGELMVMEHMKLRDYAELDKTA
eukprot:TRINITY_DN279_c0_g1_i2.p1 TRINITY_DN279_c0_g1~~TRINITY_DN279_c0_g1_i2.p1  ORF type:complete len:621 (+),score=73.43 TRINITY_DN279_c0_g1_i2:105-1967(+)